MPFYHAVGEIPHKRHTQFRKPDGSLHAEELVGQEGFSSDASLLYHRHLPTAIVKAEPVEQPAPDEQLVANHPLLPRHFHTGGLPAGGDLVTGRQLLLANGDVRLSFVAADRGSELYRNAIGDELVYLQSGRARLESVFGALDAGEGDYVLVPNGTTHRWLPAGDPPLRALVIEASGHVRPPERYRSRHGQFLEHAPYCERDLRSSSEPLLVDEGETAVLVRHRAGLTRLTYLHHPFDVVGWDGYLYPYAFNIHDFEPIVKRVHMPPPTHQTFEGPSFVVCSFCPRPLDFDPAAVPIPYNHHNVDSDEVLFYAGGDYSARKGSGIGLGSISLHPSGFTHGPQPGSVEAAIGQQRTDELAVMVDTFRPLLLGPAAQRSEDPEYAWSWARGQQARNS